MTQRSHHRETLPGAGLAYSGLAWKSRSFGALVLSALTAPLLACGDDGPTGPPPVASVEVTSPIEDVMAAGRSVQLTAIARDASGTTIPGASFTWSSADESVASVDGAGLVQGRAGGTATISATADGVSGSLGMEVVPADLTKILALLGDAYTGRLAGSLTAGPGDAVQSALQDCSDALDAGHVVNLQSCLQRIQSQTATDPTDRALLAVLGLIGLGAELLLHL